MADTLGMRDTRIPEAVGRSFASAWASPEGMLGASAPLGAASTARLSEEAIAGFIEKFAPEAQKIAKALNASRFGGRYRDFVDDAANEALMEVYTQLKGGAPSEAALLIAQSAVSRVLRDQDRVAARLAPLGNTAEGLEVLPQVDILSAIQQPMAAEPEAPRSLFDEALADNPLLRGFAVRHERKWSAPNAPLPEAQLSATVDQLENMDPLRRAVVEGRMEGKTLGQIAQETGASASTVKRVVAEAKAGQTTLERDVAKELKRLRKDFIGKYYERGKVTSYGEAFDKALTGLPPPDAGLLRSYFVYNRPPSSTAQAGRAGATTDTLYDLAQQVFRQMRATGAAR
jgi:DNA-directed RNA polymerase specialized sigma24 family protein